MYWRSIETAPKDGTWILIRGRNAADYPMIPVVCAWRRAASAGHMAWLDSASLRDMSHLISDVPHGGEADWMPLPTPIAIAMEAREGGDHEDGRHA